MNLANRSVKSLIKRSAQTAAFNQAVDMALESLEGRRMFAVSAVSIGGVLNVFGDSHANDIIVSRDVAGLLLVNGGNVPIIGTPANIANTKLIQVFGLSGDDTITLDEGNGSLPKANLFGGSGNDILTGGSGSDRLFGEAGNDQLLGKGGVDFLFGGSGNDILTGGTDNDQVFGQAGNDRMIWNPGEGSDLNEGGSGIDTVEVNGGIGAENFTATPNGTRVRFDRVSPGPFFIDIGTSENLVLNANGGDDTFTGSNGLAPLISLTVDGGTGNDTITGGDGNDTLLGGDGNDLITGGRGVDTALMGAGDDTFVWNPGDGSDIVEGQDGNDTMVFNGASGNENITLSANGSRLKLFRDAGNITMDTNGVEQVNIATLGGADTVTVNDLTGTGVATVNVDLAGAPGTGDGQADTVTVNGTNNADLITVAGNNGSVHVGGLAARVNIFNSEPLNDQLIVNALGGADTVDATALEATSIKLVLNGGAGNDVLLGSQGDDTFIWNPGDASDTIEGRNGNDTLVFNGNGADEKMVLSANGNRLRLTRDVGSIVMDVNDTENVNVNALGGADTLTVNDLSGTDVVRVSVDLGVNGAPDGAADAVIVNGTNDPDVINLTGDASAVEVTGLFAQVEIRNLDTNDKITASGLGGDDDIVASGLSVGVSMDGGEGDDILFGGDGNDSLAGGNGDDILIGNDGQDVLDGGAGDNQLFQ